MQSRICHYSSTVGDVIHFILKLDTLDKKKGIKNESAVQEKRHETQLKTRESRKEKGKREKKNREYVMGQ